MKPMMAVIFLLILGVAKPATALPLEAVNSGFIDADSVFGDIGYDLRGTGFEIGPGAESSVYSPTPPVTRVFFTLDNLFPLGRPPENQYVEVFLQHGAVNLGLIPNTGDKLSMPFTMTGVTGFYDLSADPSFAFAHRQPQEDLIGQGTLTITNQTFPGSVLFDFRYVFSVPEPSALLLLCAGIVAVGIKRYYTP
jgi:hypothetical protein